MLTIAISLILLHHLLLSALTLCWFVVLISHHHLLFFHLLDGHLLLLLLLFNCNRSLHTLYLLSTWVLFLRLPGRWLHRLRVEFGRRLRRALLFNNRDYLSSPSRCLLELLQDFLLHRCEICLKGLFHAHTTCYVHFTARASVENRLILSWLL